MADIKTIMSWLEGLTESDWRMFHSDSEVQNIANETLELLKEQEERINQLEYELYVAQDNLNYYINGNE